MAKSKKRRTTTRRRRPSSPKPKPVSPTGVVTLPQDVELRPGRGSRERGGGSGGHYWHIHVRERRTGYVFINVVQDERHGEHASITIKLNRTQQGRGIGRIAYRLACEQSSHDEIYAHMRKSNTASRKAAAHAGFQELSDPTDGQLTMVWTREEARGEQ